MNLTRDDLKALAEKHEGWCVSLYMPAHKAGKEVQQDQIRFKNLLKDAEEKLQRRGLRAPEAQQMLEPGQRLLKDNFFWLHQSDGLAVFACPGDFRHYRLPHEVRELVVITAGFHIKPLLPLLTGDGAFYVLALSQNRVRLLRGTRFSIAEVDLEGVPASLAEALKYDDPERQIQLHTGTSSRAGERSAIFHGHGVGTDDSKTNILRYFQRIDRGLQEMFKEEQAPLVLSGVEYLLPIYREANTYLNLLEEGITGNPDETSARILHEKAWDIAGPRFRQAQKAAAAKFRELQGTGRASGDYNMIVPAAHHGRIDFLFVDVDSQLWGLYDDATGGITVHEKPESTDRDLLDYAALETLLNSGTVFAVGKRDLPDGSPLAAVFRY